MSKRNVPHCRCGRPMTNRHDTRESKFGPWCRRCWEKLPAHLRRPAKVGQR